MSDPLLEGTATQTPEEQHEARKLDGPPTLPGYELETLQGRGSFGEVWSGLQLRSGQKVAVKIFLATDPHFHAEVERLSQVAEHPHVVSLLDADLDGEPPYFVMNLYPGSLADWFKKQTPPIDPAPVVKWLEQIAKALRHTHQRGLLHCDLKPSNVLLDIEGQAQLADFGQSILRERGKRSLGTTGFMAPEQSQPKAVPDVRWDVYALGATVYFLLTGHRPEGQPLRKLNSKVDADLAAIVHACLELDPARRPEGMAPILEDLERRRKKLPLLCRRPWTTGYVTHRFLKRHALASAFAGVLTATLAAGGWVLWEQFQSTKAMLAQQNFRQGWNRADDGEWAQAMLWWAEAVRFAPDHAGYRRPLRHYPFRVERMLVHNKLLERCLFSPDGKRVLAASRDGSARLWDVATGQLVTEIPPAGGRVPDDPLNQERSLRAAAFAPDGSFATAALSGPLRLWDKDGKPKGTLPPAHEVVYGGGRLLATSGANVTVYEGAQKLYEKARESPRLTMGSDARAVLSPDGGRLLTWQGAQAVLRDLTTGKEVPLKNQAPILSACFGNHQLALGTEAGRVNLWTFDGQLEKHLTPSEPAYFLSLQDGLLAVAGYMGAVEVWDVAEKRSLFARQRLRWAMLGCEFAGKDRVLTWSYYGVARLWDAQTGKPLTPSFLNEGALKSADLSPDGKLLALAAGDGTVRLIQLAPEAPAELALQEAQAPGPGFFTTISYFSPDGRTLLGCGLDGTSRLWDTASGKPHAVKLQTPAQPGVPLQGGFSPDGKSFVVGGIGPRAFRTDTCAPLGPALPPSKSGYFFACLDTEGRRMATLEFDSTIQLWDTATAKPLGAAFKSGPMPITATFSPDGQHLAVGCFDQFVRIFTDGVQTSSFKHEMFVPAVRYDPRGTRLFTGAGDGTARLWRDGQPTSAPMPHNGAVLSLAFGEQCVASASLDAHARLWDADGEPLTQPLPHPRLTAVGFSADKQTLLSASSDRILRWDAALDTKESPAQLRLRAEVETGMALDGAGGRLQLGLQGWWPRLQFTGPMPTLRPLSAAEWEARRQELKRP